MQIPTNFSAAQAASIASAVSSRDKDSGVSPATGSAADAIQTHLEKSESASPDRDAQGQGDGLGHHARRPKDENEVATGEPDAPMALAPVSGDPPPASLDCMC